LAEWLASRSTVITLAVIGGVISVIVSMLQSRGKLSEERVRRYNRVGYGFMWASIALFIYAGFRAGWE
jgi:ABC-type arginine transport system permease subunit